MGWAVLYIAFGIVALWLLGEVLLQYKARLRWRLLAFAGFLGVVVGVLIASVVVIGLGAAAFAVGQTYVTLSFRSGFAAGWAMNAPALGGSKRRRGERGRQEPTLEVSGLEAEGGYDEAGAYRRDPSAYGQEDDYDHDDVFTPARSAHDPTAAESTAVYEPQPVPEDTGSYGVYDTNGYQPAGQQAQDQYTAQAADQSYSYDYSGYGQQQGYDAAGQQQYAAYSDPYIGSSNYGQGSYDNTYGDQQYYGQQDYTQDQYAGTYGGETPPGGVWVPQQRNTDEYGQELPPEQPYPYQGGGQQPQGNGFDEQYRF
ncbi:hypothetical protein ABZ281_41685 [Streptomyces sp. NPDC006265]|uniref:SCO2102 family sporulation regulator n=1 Tax=Streptomyces sp. NPDC006265 TaxID=3156740 RepID=UPI0033B9A545